MGNLPSKFGHAWPLGSQIIRYVRDVRTDRRMDKKERFPMVGGIKSLHPNVIRNVPTSTTMVESNTSNSKLSTVEFKLLLAHLQTIKQNFSNTDSTSRKDIILMQVTFKLKNISFKSFNRQIQPQK